MRESQGTDVIIIGAGPYGLSVAAHLRSTGMSVVVFGEPMSFWQRNMPKGMLLRSPYPACNIDTPGALTLDDFAHATGATVPRPVPLERFVQFGQWVQGHVAPNVDTRRVTSVRREGDGFTVTVQDGEKFRSRSVVVAAGIARFAWRPPEFATLSADVVSHTVDEADLSRYAGKEVAVIGAGQSALESAALLCESGASPEIIARGPVHFVVRRGWLHTGPTRLLHHRYEIGPAGLSHLVTWPSVFTRIPRPTQDTLAARAIRPVGADWLAPRLEHVAKTINCSTSQAEVAAAGRVQLTLTDGTKRRVDNVLLATGYRVDIARFEFLDEEILRSIDQVNGYPRLNGGFESSLPGLHFVGAPSAWSYGPLVRFVCGTAYTGSRVAHAIERRIGKGSNATLEPMRHAA